MPTRDHAAAKPASAVSAALAVGVPETNTVIVRSRGGFSGRVPEDWCERFMRAYDVQLQDWLDACAKGEVGGPSSWDGYAAAVATDAGPASQTSGTWAKITMRDKPSIYG